MLLVTLDEPMVRAETLRLGERLFAAGMPPAAEIVNRAAGTVLPAATTRTWTAPVVAEPRGAEALAAFAAAWSPAE